MTDRIDGRWVFAGCSLLAAGASFVFAGCADGFWTALVLRFLNGVALAGVHMPGLKLLVDRVMGRARARGTAIYTSSYALGSAGSFLVAGIVDTTFGWRGTFIISGIVPLLAIAAITLLPAVAEPLPAGAFVLDFRPVLRDRALMAYVLAFAGNTWEVFSVRVWFVAYLAWTLSLPGNYLPLPGLAVISGLASLAGFPVSIAVAELALRYGRRVIVATCLTSVLVCLALAVDGGRANHLWCCRCWCWCRSPASPMPARSPAARSRPQIRHGEGRRLPLTPLPATLRPLSVQSRSVLRSTSSVVPAAPRVGLRRLPPWLWARPQPHGRCGVPATDQPNQCGRRDSRLSSTEFRWRDRAGAGRQPMARGAGIAEAAEHTTETFPLIDKLGSYLSLSPVEVEFLRDLHRRKRRFGRHRDIIAQGRPYRSVFILCSGFVCRYKILPDGKRQVLNLGLPGDLIGLPACCLRECS